jgi:hypothetical protein
LCSYSPRHRSKNCSNNNERIKLLTATHQDTEAKTIENKY